MGVDQILNGRAVEVQSATVKDLLDAGAIETVKGPNELHEWAKAGDTAADIQSRIDSLSASVPDPGRAVLHGPESIVTLSSPIEVPSNIWLKDWQIKTADGADITPVKTKNFDSLVGSNSWTDIPANFGFENVYIDGNKANNATGRGLAIYGKRYFVDNVYISQTADEGFYSETGDGNGASQWGMPESKIGSLYIEESGLHGFHFRGPHDTVADHIFVVNSADKGILTQTDNSNGTYSAAGLQVSYAHPYSNAGGSKFGDTSYIGMLGCDNETVTVTDNCHVSMARLIGNECSLTLDGTAYIGQVAGRYGGSSGKTGVHLTSNAIRSWIGTIDIDRFTGSGVIVDAHEVTLGDVRAYNCDPYGVKIGDTQNVGRCSVHLKDVNACGTAGLYYNGGGFGGNRVTGGSNITSGNNAIDLTDGSEPYSNDMFDLRFDGAGSNTGNSVERKRSSISGDGTDTYTVNHSLFTSPRYVTVQGVAGGPTAQYTQNYTDSSFDVVFESTTSANFAVAYQASVKGRQ